ncbi:hypothetical protein, partial [Desulfovibrio sp. MES5]|uniref:hypothetical protein n=1 Tax=Desulfovibrio sp. MES5 TaxID=1899016 RepID=UPI0025C73F34
TGAGNGCRENGYSQCENALEWLWLLGGHWLCLQSGVCNNESPAGIPAGLLRVSYCCMLDVSACSTKEPSQE